MTTFNSPMTMLYRLSMLIAVLSLVACSDSDDLSVTPGPAFMPDPFLSIANPSVEPAPEIGAIFVQSSSFDLASVGYMQAEYFVSGTASAFTNLNELGGDGRWEVEAGEQADYTTRIVVYRPIDPADFNGTVFVEWLNVTAGFDTAPGWANGHVEMIRGGYSWVGVSAQLIGIEGREGSLAPLHLKGVNAERYAALSHPGDSFSYDIFSQVAQAVRNPGDIDPLDGLGVERLIAHGESQSASRMTTYVNAIQLLYDPFDAYLVHSRFSGSSTLAQEPLVEIDTPDIVTIRDDLNVPVLVFETETDLLPNGSVLSRQDDTDIFRLWEVAGTAHVDYYSALAGGLDATGEPMFAVVVEESSVLGILNCELPFNSGPQHYVFNAAVDALDRWLRSGETPPQAPRLQVAADNSAFLFDDNGNALGGIRTPHVDAPTAVLSGRGQPPGDLFCSLFGTTLLYTAEQMASLYVDEAGYVAAVSQAAESAVAAGFLLQPDADAIIAWAPEQWRLQTLAE